MLYDDTSHLKEEVQKLLYEQSANVWLDAHTLDFTMGSDKGGEDRNVLSIAIGEIDPELEQWEHEIQDLTVPAGMGEYDTAAFTDRAARERAGIRLRIKALQVVKQRVKTPVLITQFASSTSWRRRAGQGASWIRPTTRSTITSKRTLKTFTPNCRGQRACLSQRLRRPFASSYAGQTRDQVCRGPFLPTHGCTSHVWRWGREAARGGNSI